MGRAKNSGVQLTENDAAEVKGMIARGDRQHDIAAWFGVNGGRIGEISTGKTFSYTQPADPSKLPPPGPYTSGKENQILKLKLEKMQAALAVALTKQKAQNNTDT